MGREPPHPSRHATGKPLRATPLRRTRLSSETGQYLAQPVPVEPAEIGSLSIGVFEPVGEEHDALRIGAMRETAHVAGFMDGFLDRSAPEQLVIGRQAVEFGPQSCEGYDRRTDGGIGLAEDEIELRHEKIPVNDAENTAVSAFGRMRGAQPVKKRGRVILLAEGCERVCWHCHGFRSRDADVEGLFNILPDLFEDRRFNLSEGNEVQPVHRLPDRLRPVAGHGRPTVAKGPITADEGVICRAVSIADCLATKASTTAV